MPEFRFKEQALNTENDLNSEVKTHLDPSGSLELLVPARDLSAGRAAILCGADAVYIGPERFGAREAAGNSIEDIAELARFAHLYYARVYSTLNTLLFDHELDPALKLAHRLYEAGVDGLIIQDPGLLELDLPPLPVIASTQMNNQTPGQVAFLEAVGFSRAILARELTLDQIRAIRAATTIGLECFVHGALCVGVSGQCYMSYALGGRSGNRGQCAQPCRRRYTLRNGKGLAVGPDRYYLSLKDLNLSGHLADLIDAGVTSFKIEGRLKDTAYVATVTAAYRQRLDSIIAEKGLQKSSSGTVSCQFQPDPARVFNRGFTDYGLTGRRGGWGSPDTPKSIGELMGRVSRVTPRFFTLDRPADLHNGDGICFFTGPNRDLSGTQINRVEGDRVFPLDMTGIQMGQDIYRNRDHAAESLFKTIPAQRKISVRLTLQESDRGVRLTGRDDDGNLAQVDLAVDKVPAQKPEAALDTIQTQLQKLGNTLFHCQGLEIALSQPLFFPVSVLNQLKRDWVERMLAVREQNRPRPQSTIQPNQTPCPQTRLAWQGNVLNRKARDFYQRHGVELIEPGAETGRNLVGEKVLTTKYCIRRELGLCAGKPNGPDEIWTLEDEAGALFDIRFRCGECGMDIYLVKKA